MGPELSDKEAEQALREINERYDFIKDAGELGFWFCNLPFDKLHWDTRVKEHFWLPPEAPVTIETFYQCIHPDDRERTRKAISESIENHTRYEIEYRTVSQSGQEKWIRAVGRTFYDSSGHPRRFDGLTLDVTQKKQAEAILRRDREELERLVSERTASLREIIGELEAFSYSIAHDMRAPLRSLQGYSGILLSDHGSKLDSECQSYLEMIARSAKRMDRLIQDVLNYSRLVRGNYDLEEVDLEPLLRGIVDTYPQLNAAGVEIVFRGPFPRVLGNEAMLTQIFSNLMGNAVKFVSPGVKPRLVLWADSQTRSVRVFVQDNGIGIEADQREKIFGIFQRANKGFEGTGIGLAIVKKAAERIGGKVGVDSEPGNGSTFWIELQAATGRQNE